MDLMERTEDSKVKLKVLEEILDEASEQVTNARKLLNEALHYYNFANKQYLEELNSMREVQQD